jgi:hypothetical protein
MVTPSTKVLDLNPDSIIDISDISFFAGNVAKTCS